MMQYRPLGQSGIQASVVGLGTWAIGGRLWGGADEDDSIATLHAALDAGMNLIDTAPFYGFGLSERIVGKAVKGRRDKAVIATKCGILWDAEQGEFFFNTTDDTDPARPIVRKVHKCLHPHSIEREVKASLARLDTDYIDLYQTHWQESTTPIEDTMACLMKLKDDGLVRAIGVSNATPDQMDQYHSHGRLDSDQEKYSMIDRAIEADKLPYCRTHGIAVLSYSSLALGLLTGKVDADRQFASGDFRASHPRFSPDNRRKVAAMLDEFKPVAARHNITIAQLAIAWTIAQPGVTHALCGGRKPEQSLENAKAGDVKLSGEDLTLMNAALARHSIE